MKKMSLMKKMTSLIVALALMLTMIPAALAEEPMRVSLSTEAGAIKPGEEFTVTVNVSEGSKMGAFDYTINYNSDEVEVVKAVKGDAFKRWTDRLDEEGKSSPTWTINKEIAGELNLAIASPEWMTEGGPLLVVTFKAKTEAVMGDAQITQTIKNCEHAKGQGAMETVPAINEEDVTIKDKVKVDPDVSAITLKTAPTKTSYITGKETFDPAGGVITATYTNKATQDFNLTAEMCSGYDLNKSGKYAVDVTYKNVKAAKGFNITVAERSITSAAFTAPTEDQKNYLQGKPDQHLDLTGALWQVEYSDGSSEEIAVTEAMCSGYNLENAGAQNVTVKLPGWDTAASFEIYVKAKTVTAIAMDSTPAKTEYVAGKDTKLDVTGGKLKVTYDNGVTESVALTEAMCSGYDLNTLGAQTVKVTYGEKTTSFTINVRKEIDRLEVTPPTKLEYVKGQTFDPAGGKVKLIYTDKTEETVDLTAEMCQGMDMSKAGTYAVTVSCQNKQVEKAFEVKVIPKTIVAAQFTAPTSDQTNYLEGKKNQHLDLTGAHWTAQYNDGDEKEIAVTEAMCSDYDFNKPGNQTVTVTLPEWKTPATFAITVIEKTVTGVSMNTLPGKTEYIAGQDTSLDVTGGKLSVAYDNGNSEIVNLTADMCSTVDLMKLGVQTVKVTYAEKETSFDISVKKALKTIEWNTEPTKTTYKQGSAFAADGAIDAIYTDGSKVLDIPVTAEMCSGYQMDKAGKQTVVVTYTQKAEETIAAGSKNLSYTIAIDGITLKTTPQKLEYKMGEALNPAGLSVVFYDSAKDAEATIAWESTLLKVSGYDANKEGTQKITVIYTDHNTKEEYQLKDAFEVTVVKQIPVNNDKSTKDGKNNSSNPSTGTAAGSAAVIAALFVLTAVGIKAYQIRRK